MTDHLWDPTAPADPAVAAVEARLASLRFDPAARPFVPPAASVAPFARPVRPWRRVVLPLATAFAASVALFAGLAAWHEWRLDWRDGAPWHVSDGRQWAVGAALTADRETRVSIARLGVIDVRPGAALQLDQTGPARHRMRLDRGAIDVRVWAPPGRVAVATPAGDVIDLGCIFALRVDDAGAAHLTVETGWVNLQNPQGNTFVPAGASASMTAGVAPEVPVYDDAAAEFRAAVRQLEHHAETPDPGWLRTITFEARPRDVLTLLMLSDVDGLGGPVRAALLERASVLSAAPSPDAVARIVAGDRDLFWQWYDALPLPSLKNWWANWRDVFPRGPRAR